MEISFDDDDDDTTFPFRPLLLLPVLGLQHRPFLLLGVVVVLLTDFVGVFCRNWTSLSKVTLDLFFLLLPLFVEEDDDDDDDDDVGVNDGVVFVPVFDDDDDDGMSFFLTGVEDDGDANGDVNVDVDSNVDDDNDNDNDDDSDDLLCFRIETAFFVFGDLNLKLDSMQLVL